VRLGDADGTQLGVATAVESFADGLHPAARAVLGLEDRHLVAVLHQVVGGAQPGEPGTEHHHAVAAAASVRRSRGWRASLVGQRDCAGGGEVLEERSAIE